MGHHIGFRNTYLNCFWSLYPSICTVDPFDHGRSTSPTPNHQHSLAAPAFPFDQMRFIKNISHIAFFFPNCDLIVKSLFPMHYLLLRLFCYLINRTTYHPFETASETLYLHFYKYRFISLHRIVSPTLKCNNSTCSA